MKKKVDETDYGYLAILIIFIIIFLAGFILGIVGFALIVNHMKTENELSYCLEFTYLNTQLYEGVFQSESKYNGIGQVKLKSFNLYYLFRFNFNEVPQIYVKKIQDFSNEKNMYKIPYSKIIFPPDDKPFLNQFSKTNGVIEGNVFISNEFYKEISESSFNFYFVVQINNEILVAPINKKC